MKNLAEKSNASRINLTVILPKGIKGGMVKLVRIDGKLIKLKAGNKKRKPYPERKRIYDKEFQDALI